VEIFIKKLLITKVPLTNDLGDGSHKGQLPIFFIDKIDKDVFNNIDTADERFEKLGLLLF
jgi:hypothetical protein